MYPVLKPASSLKGLIRCCCNAVRYYSSAAAPLAGKWDLMGAIVVERKPVITRELEDIEKSLSEVLQRIEFEKSLKSDHEIADELEKKQAELLKKGELQDVDLDIAVKQTAQDFKDLCTEELAKFKFAPRVTDDDKRKDQKSLNRCLDSHLLLLIEHKIGKDFKWVVPQSVHKEGEALHETAIRALHENCGEQLKVKVLGSAPWGFYKYKYPKEVRSSEAIGAKVFFFKATYLSGQVQLIPGDNRDFKWLESKDIFNVQPYEYSNSISQFMLSCKK